MFNCKLGYTAFGRQYDGKNGYPGPRSNPQTVYGACTKDTSASAIAGGADIGLLRLNTWHPYTSANDTQLKHEPHEPVYYNS